jgi:predicted kinase
MAKWHVSRKGKITKCNAKKNCPLGGLTLNNSNDSQDFNNKIDEIEKESKEQKEVLDEKLSKNEDFSSFEALKRSTFIQKKIDILIDLHQDTKSKYYDSTKHQWSPERRKLHKKLINKMLDKYNNVPNEGQVIMSAGLPGAGKTTVLTKTLKYSVNDYATISSDDFKELLAEEGGIPKVDGLYPMEASPLVHEESSYLADTLLNKLAKEHKNIIYDFTCKNANKTRKRLNTFKNYGYEMKNVQFVYVDIPPDVAQERAKSRYTMGLNHNKKIGGRFLPPEIIDKCRTDSKKYNSKNAESVSELAHDKNIDISTPLVYDNTGAGPVKIDSQHFLNGGNIK